MSDQVIEQKIVAKGLSAPRVTLAEFEANIADVEIVKHVSKTGQVLRWAIFTTQNGFAVVGKPSVSASPENDDAEIGETDARENTRVELWPLMGYALKERLAFTEAFGQLVEAPSAAEIVTFEQFVQYGRDNGGNIVNGMPWSFSFRGHPATHENDRCYLIGVNASQVRFTPDEVLVINPNGSLATLKTGSLSA